MTHRPLDSRNPMDSPPGVRCTARSKRSGDRCKRPAMLGGNVCRSHGGASPRARAAARRRLDQAADVLVQRLLALALDGDAPDSVALQAINSALDRAGMSAKQALEVEVTTQPWQAAMANVVGIDRISKAESRARRGLEPDRLALPRAEQTEPLDAEVVDAPGEPPAPKSRPPWEDEPPPPRPSTALMTVEQAAAETAAIRAQQRASFGRTKRVSSRRV